MKYTADFLVHHNVGDMFQSPNGDVWKFTDILGQRAEPKGIWNRITGRQYIVERATVERIWQYPVKRKKVHPNLPETTGVWARK